MSSPPEPPKNAPTTHSKETKVGELVVIVASLMALNALAIDIMLPALGVIARDFSITNDNDQQLVVIAYVLGFGVPQLFWGPLSDRIGRRATIFITLTG